MAQVKILQLTKTNYDKNQSGTPPAGVTTRHPLAVQAKAASYNKEQQQQLQDASGA